MLHGIPENLRQEKIASLSYATIKKNILNINNTDINKTDINNTDINNSSSNNTVIQKKISVKNAKFIQQAIQVNDISLLVLNSNNNRSYLLIQNNGTSDIFINFGSKATSNSMIISSGWSYEPNIPPTNSIYIKSPNGITNSCVINEGTTV